MKNVFCIFSYVLCLMYFISGGVKCSINNNDNDLLVKVANDYIKKNISFTKSKKKQLFDGIVLFVVSVGGIGSLILLLKYINTFEKDFFNPLHDSVNNFLDAINSISYKKVYMKDEHGVLLKDKKGELIEDKKFMPVNVFKEFVKQAEGRTREIAEYVKDTFPKDSFAHKKLLKLINDPAKFFTELGNDVVSDKENYGELFNSLKDFLEESGVMKSAVGGIKDKTVELGKNVGNKVLDVGKNVWKKAGDFLWGKKNEAVSA